MTTITGTYHNGKLKLDRPLKTKRAMKAAAFTQGNVYWRVPYVDWLIEKLMLIRKLYKTELKK